MEAAVSVIVSSMSVIIPAILRALDFGDPFMQEEAVDPSFDTGVEIARMNLTRVELGLPTTRVVAGNDDRRGVASPVIPQSNGTRFVWTQSAVRNTGFGRFIGDFGDDKDPSAPR